MGFLSKLLGSGVGEIATSVADVVDRFVETDEERKAADILLMKVQQQPDKWQMEINKIEAAHRSVFIAGWRPFIGWVCGFGLAFHFIIFPIFEWSTKLAGTPIDAPQLETGALISLVIALLGLGATRTYEKKHGLTK
jgi:hypothetical protein